jgi:putative membrane protein
MNPLGRFTFACALTCIALGCERTGDRDAATVVGDTTVAAEAADTPPTDREIAHILQTSNAVILRQSSLAKTRLQHGAGRALADSLIADHTAYNLRAQRTFLAINTVPEEHAHSELMVSRAAETRALLEGSSDADFERAYIADVLTVHQELIDLVDRVLVANARDPFLRELLQEYRAMIERHLDSARRQSAE